MVRLMDDRKAKGMEMTWLEQVVINKVFTDHELNTEESLCFQNLLKEYLKRG